MLPSRSNTLSTPARCKASIQPIPEGPAPTIMVFKLIFIVFQLFSLAKLSILLANLGASFAYFCLLFRLLLHAPSSQRLKLKLASALAHNFLNADWGFIPVKGTKKEKFIVGGITISI